MNPKRVSVRPAHSPEPDGFVVWVYGRKVQLQLHFPPHYSRPKALRECIELWRATMEEIA